jgi:hypothetical protein
MVISDIDKLLSWAIKLYDILKEKRARPKEQLEQDVRSLYEQFEQVHASYKESFSRYREQILNATDANWIRPLQATLEGDNVFSGDMRNKLVRLSQRLEDESWGPFIKSICDYVMDARLVEPLGKEFHPHEVQRWRQGFSKTLGRIEEENWQLVLDPIGARPPLSPKETAQELKQITQKVSFGRKVSKQDALKRAAALWALNGVVNDMQGQHDRVFQAYEQASKKLK